MFKGLRKQKGFTLIELLVVIGIIGIIMGITLLGVMSAVNKAKDSSVERDCGQIRIEAAKIYAEDKSFAALCQDVEQLSVLNESDPDLALMAADIRKYNRGLDPVCYTTGKDYCVAATLFTGGSYCVDSTGYAGRGLSVCDSSVAKCH